MREMAKAMLRSQNVIEEHVFDVETILGELCGNVERHGRSESGMYHLDMTAYHGMVKIKIVDHGPGFDFARIAESAPMAFDLAESEDFDVDALLAQFTERDDQLASDTEQKRYGGWGIPTVKSLSAAVCYEQTIPHGTTVYVEKLITYSGDTDKSESSKSTFSSLPPKNNTESDLLLRNVNVEREVEWAV